MRVGIIGAGAAGCGAAALLDQTTGWTVALFERAETIGGRMATGRHGEITYDPGANYLKADDRVLELLRETVPTTDIESFDDPIWVFDKGGTVTPGRDERERKWTYRDGIRTLAHRLLEPTRASVSRETTITGLKRQSSSWLLEDEGGNQWGPYDAIICTTPPPETVTLLAGAAWESDLRSTLVERLRTLEYRTIWTSVLGYERELERPYYALVNPGKDHDIGWIARESCKPGRVPAGEEAIVVQANHEWSVAHFEDDPTANAARLAELTARIMDEPALAEPAWSAWDRWRFAIPEAAPPHGIVQTAREDDLYLCGDWLEGEGRIHTAVRQGLETAERLVTRYA